MSDNQKGVDGEWFKKNCPNLYDAIRNKPRHQYELYGMKFTCTESQFHFIKWGLEKQKDHMMFKFTMHAHLEPCDQWTKMNMN